MTTTPTQGAELVALAEKCGAQQCGESGEFLGFPSVESLEAFAAALRFPGQQAGEPSEEPQPTTATVPVGELVALRRNAARYRVLRDARHGFNAYRLSPKPGKRWRGYGDEGDILKGEALDAAIDAARVSIDIREDATQAGKEEMYEAKQASDKATAPRGRWEGFTWNPYFKQANEPGGGS